jgi:hypothetical protein
MEMPTGPEIDAANALMRRAHRHESDLAFHCKEARVHQ